MGGEGDRVLGGRDGPRCGDGLCDVARRRCVNAGDVEPGARATPAPPEAAAPTPAPVAVDVGPNRGSLPNRSPRRRPERSSPAAAGGGAKWDSRPNRSSRRTPERSAPAAAGGVKQGAALDQRSIRTLESSACSSTACNMRGLISIKVVTFFGWSLTSGL